MHTFQKSGSPSVVTSNYFTKSPPTFYLVRNSFVTQISRSISFSLRPYLLSSRCKVYLQSCPTSTATYEYTQRLLAHPSPVQQCKLCGPSWPSFHCLLVIIMPAMGRKKDRKSVVGPPPPPPHDFQAPASLKSILVSPKLPSLP